MFTALRTGLAVGLFDQAIVSFGNFGLTIMLARTLPLHDYGMISVVLSFMFFLNTLHAAIVGYPLSVRSASADRSTRHDLLCTASILTTLCAPVALAVLGGALASLEHLELLPFAFAALLLWQIQETFRRSALAKASNPASLASDTVRYLGLLAAVIALRHVLSMRFVLIAIASTSAVAAAPILLLRHHLSKALSNFHRDALIHWKLGAPVLGANLLAALSTQWFLWLLAWQHGPEMSGALAALANIVAISSPVMLGVENVMVPEIARLREAMSFDDLKRMLAKRSAACGLLLAPFFLAISLYPQTAMRLFYGMGNPFAHEIWPLRLLVVTYASYLASFILGAALRGYRSGTAVFRMQLFPALLGITLGSWLTIRFGLVGACMSSLMCGLLRAGLGLHFVLGLRPLIARLPHHTRTVAAVASS